MRISIQSKGVEITDALDSVIREKVDRLTRYFDKIEDATVFIHQYSDHIEAEMKLLVPMDKLFGKENGESVEAAVDMCVDNMKRQILKHKERVLKVGERRVSD